MTSLPSSPSSSRSRRFAALATLAGTAADLDRRRLDGARADLDRLERQRRELGEHARRYARDALERPRGIDPRTFAHRREFAAALIARADALCADIDRCEARVRDAAERHVTALAKERALEALRRRRSEEEALAATREERRRDDETWRSRSVGRRFA